LYDSVQDTYERNYVDSLSDDFVERMVAELKKNKPEIVRLHVSGDFYDASYIQKWTELCRQFSSTIFFAYTRSWRVPELRPALGQFNRLPNTHLWWSVDGDTDAMNGRPPIWKNVRVAYMQVAADETIPHYVDLVFRDGERKPRKYSNGRLICPAENGVKTHSKITCSACGICFNSRPTPRKVMEEAFIVS
jgi:hypothetical protein